MLDLTLITDMESFLQWYQQLNPMEAIDQSEAMDIFFNLNDYEILGV
jgi:hypothetical protein